MEYTFRASSKSIMAEAYGVSTLTFNRWLKPIEHQIGDYLSRAYTPNQVAQIVQHLGNPVHPELICV